MNYFPFHVGDWVLHTSHLSPEEEAVYLRLLCHYYDTEQPIPEETNPVIRRLRLGSQVETVRLILSEFFTLEDDGWHNARADREIRAYNDKAKKARENGKKGGRPKTYEKKEEKTNPVISGLAKKTQTKANQEPITNNQSISTNVDIGADKKAKSAAIPDWIPRDAWLGFVEMRKAKKKPLTERAIHGIEKKLIAFMNQGYDIAQVLDQSTINGWTDVYAPKDNNTGAYYATNQRLTPAQQRAAESQRISDILRQGAAGILGYNREDIRPTTDCEAELVPARLSDSRGGDGGGETLGEFIPATKTFD